MVEGILAFVGLCIGSFVNAFVWRLHEKKDWLVDRSECVYCHHKLSGLDLLPVVSWLILKGKCRYCGKRISLQYPVIELLVSTLFVISYIFWPNSLSSAWNIVVFVLWLLVAAGLIALTIYDLRWMLLPTKVIYFLVCLALAMSLISIYNSGDYLMTFINYLTACAVGAGIFYLIFLLSRGNWIGGGDVRLGFLLGLLAATPARSFLIIFLASLIGTVVSLALISSRRLKRSSLIPFGPFLIVAMFIVQFSGQYIIQWYGRLFLGA